MGIIAFIILGLLAGAIAKAILPGDEVRSWLRRLVERRVGEAGAS